MTYVCSTHGTPVSRVETGIDNRKLGFCKTCRGAKPLPSNDPEMAKRLVAAEMKRPIKSRLIPVVTKVEFDRLEAERERKRRQRVEVAPELSPWASMVPVESKPKYGRKAGA